MARLARIGPHSWANFAHKWPTRPLFVGEIRMVWLPTIFRQKCQPSGHSRHLREGHLLKSWHPQVGQVWNTWVPRISDAITCCVGMVRLEWLEYVQKNRDNKVGRFCSLLHGDCHLPTWIHGMIMIPDRHGADSVTCGSTIDRLCPHLEVSWIIIASLMFSKSMNKVDMSRLKYKKIEKTTQTCVPYLSDVRWNSACRVFGLARLPWTYVAGRLQWYQCHMQANPFVELALARTTSPPACIWNLWLFSFCDIVTGCKHTHTHAHTHRHTTTHPIIPGRLES